MTPSSPSRVRPLSLVHRDVYSFRRVYFPYWTSECQKMTFIFLVRYWNFLKYLRIESLVTCG